VPVKRGRRLVVDASVAGAAGGKTATAPASTRCRDFLLTLLRETDCCIVMSPKLRDEWDKHQSALASTWLTTMTSRRRVLILVDLPSSNRMRREIERVATKKKSEVDALRKDFHLIEAAIAHDKTVVSSDEIVRRLFKAAAHSVAVIKKVVWVNPVAPAEEPIAWLLGGAKAENIRMLGYVEHET
jgi:hypothetical protein